MPSGPGSGKRSSFDVNHRRKARVPRRRSFRWIKKIKRGAPQPTGVLSHISQHHKTADDRRYALDCLSHCSPRYRYSSENPNATFFDAFPQTRVQSTSRRQIDFAAQRLVVRKMDE